VIFMKRMSKCGNLMFCGSNLTSNSVELEGVIVI
jgi:hypothetical protein